MLPGLEQLILDCAPQVAPTTMTAIVRVESGGQPYALNINGTQQLSRQPRSREEASTWATWLVARGYSIDMGLAQINSANLNRLGVTPSQLFDPCTNLRAGAKILTDNYLGASQRYGGGQVALQAAISAYNTGNHQSGISNGYVAKVTAAAGGDKNNIATPPPLIRRASRDFVPRESITNFVAPQSDVATAATQATTPVRSPTTTLQKSPTYGVVKTNRSANDNHRPGDANSPLVYWVKR